MTTSPRSRSQKRTLASLAALPLTPGVSAYLARRGLLEAGTALGFGGVPDSPAPRLRQYAGRLVIPSYGPDGEVYDIAFRCTADHDCKTTVLYVDKDGKDQTCRKYLFLPGLDKRLYNLRAIADAGDTIDVCEGQLDAATLAACGLHAVGVPGANGWKEYHRRLFAGFATVRVWGDGDETGKRFAERVAHAVAGASVMMVPWGYDVNSLYVEQGRDAILKIAEGEDDDDDTEGEWGLDGDDDAPPF